MENMREMLTQTKQYSRKIAQEYPEFMKGLAAFADAAEKEGALSAKTKQLIAVAAGVVRQCDYCIGFHVKAAMDAGATKDEIMESAFVATLLGGGPAFMYAKVALKAVEDLGG